MLSNFNNFFTVTIRNDMCIYLEYNLLLHINCHVTLHDKNGAVYINNSYISLNKVQST